MDIHKKLSPMREACKKMGFIGPHSTDRFVKNGLEWLARNIGDLHVEFHRCEGWQVSTCYEEEQWKDWISGPELWEAVANSILASKPNANLQP